MTLRRRLALLILSGTLTASVAQGQGQGQVEPYALARPWSEANLVPLALPGQTLQQAFERLSAGGLSCTIQGYPMLLCRLPADRLPERCESLHVTVFADDHAWPKAHDPVDRIADMLGRRVGSVSARCDHAPDWSAEKFEPTTAAAQDAVRDAAQARAASAPDLQRLSWQMLADGAACGLTVSSDGARLSCTDGGLGAHVCSDTSATFVAPASQGTPPTLVAWRCDRGAYVPPPPDPNDHDKWAELSVVYVAQTCAMQDPAWRSSKPLARLYEERVPDWTHVESTPIGRCARAQRLVPTELCKQAFNLDLDDGRQAQDFIQRNREALRGIEDALNALFTLPQRGGADVPCPARPNAARIAPQVE